MKSGEFRGCMVEPGAFADTSALASADFASADRRLRRMLIDVNGE